MLFIQRTYPHPKVSSRRCILQYSGHWIIIHSIFFFPIRIPIGTQPQMYQNGYYYMQCNPKYSIVAVVHYHDGLYFISGGVYMLIHSCFTKYCQHVNLNIDYVVTFNISQSLTGGDKDVIISMYVSPTRRKLTDIEDVDQSFETIVYIRRHVTM